MFGYHLVMLILPMLAGMGAIAQVQPATIDVNSAIASAAQAASEYEEPLWVEQAREALGSQSDYSDEVIEAVTEAAAATGVAPEVIWAVAYTESHGFHMRENGQVKRGGAGEIGVMQVLPFWSRALNRKYGVELDLYDVSDNIMAGAMILARGGDDTKVALSYYNTGKRYRSTPYQRKVSKYLAQLTPAG